MTVQYLVTTLQGKALCVPNDESELEVLIWRATDVDWWRDWGTTVLLMDVHPEFDFSLTRVSERLG